MPLAQLTCGEKSHQFRMLWNLFECTRPEKRLSSAHKEPSGEKKNLDGKLRTQINIKNENVFKGLEYTCRNKEL